MPSKHIEISAATESPEWYYNTESRKNVKANCQVLEGSYKNFNHFSRTSLDFKGPPNRNIFLHIL